MARTMMLESVVVLEVTVRDKDKEGKPLVNKQGQPTAYYTLIGFERGQRYPELTKLNIPGPLLNNASALVGKVCNILAEVNQYRDGITLYFSEGNPVQAKQAA